MLTVKTKEHKPLTAKHYVKDYVGFLLRVKIPTTEGWETVDKPFIISGETFIIDLSHFLFDYCECDTIEDFMMDQFIDAEILQLYTSTDEFKLTFEEL